MSLWLSSLLLLLLLLESNGFPLFLAQMAKIDIKIELNGMYGSMFSYRLVLFHSIYNTAEQSCVYIWLYFGK